MKKYLLGSVVALCAAAGLQAQTYNDTVRTRTWSVYAQGGLTWWQGLRGVDVSNARHPLTPDAAVGVDYNIRPWIRVGLKAEYIMLKTTAKLGKSLPQTVADMEISGRPGTVTTNTGVVENRNNMSVAAADVNVDFNILQLWSRRKAQQLNLWIGTGVGYWHGWNRHSYATAVRKVGAAEGDGYANYYFNASIDASGTASHTNVLYIPASLSLECDITPRWTAGVFGEYKYLPLRKELTPKHVVSFGLRLAYNFVGRKMPSYRSRYFDLRAMNETLKECCSEKKSLQKQLDSKNAEINRLKSQLGDANRKLNESQNLGEAAGHDKTLGHTVYFDLNSDEISEQEKVRLDNFIAKVKAEGKDLHFVGESSKEGAAAYNQSLSERRLKAVLNYLKQQGLGNSAIKDAKAIGASAQGDATYRRVVIAE